MARATFEEHEAGEVGPGAKRGVGRVPAVDPADFDHHAHGGLIAAPRGQIKLCAPADPHPAGQTIGAG